MTTSQPEPFADLLASVRACEKDGEFFRAYDVATKALAAYPDDFPLKFRSVLALARAGATELAINRYRELGLDRASDIDSRSLWPRLMKDRAYVAPADRRPAELAKAADLYDAIYRDTNDTFPAINAASLSLLAGRRGRAAAIAGEVIALLDGSLPGQGEQAYWHWATRTEALLLLGDTEAAGKATTSAVAAGGRDYAMLASTGKQLEMLAKALGVEIGWLEQFRPGPVIHFTGHRIAQPGASGRFPAAAEAQVAAEIQSHVARIKPAFGYGSLAGGADILFAEALLRHGSSVHIVLPFRLEEFVDVSVRSSGGSWVKRFEACARAASDIRYATEDAYLGDDTLFAYASRYAMGMAVLRAQQTFARLLQVAVWDGGTAAGAAGTAIDVAQWSRLPHGQTIIAPMRKDAGKPALPPAPVHAAQQNRQARAMLFGDIKGFSKLTDSQLPRFVTGVMGALARVIDRHRQRVIFVNTWGDGIFAVFERAHHAAACALALQGEMSALDYEALELPSSLALRLGGHLGPVYASEDPVLRRTNFFGAHVSRTARIEPITPPGCVYVTEPFAAELVLEHADTYACEYVGLTDMAKNYGQLRMFLLRKRGLV